MSEKSHEQIASELCQAFTLDYNGRSANVNGDGEFDVRYDADIDRMMRHPVVAEAMRIQEAGIAGAEFIPTKASSSQVADWAMKSLKRFWENDLYKVQLSYRRGWIGGEILFKEQGAMLDQVGLKVFHFTDARPVLLGKEYAGIKVKNLREQGEATLRCAGRWPNRAWWHGHDLLTERFYGSGLLAPSHRDWQRLAEQRGVEEILDNVITRCGVAGAEIRYDEDNPAVRSADGTLDFQKAREKARQISADMNAGMNNCFSSKRDSHGEYLWAVHWPEKVLDPGPLVAYAKYLEGRVCHGIGTPRELMESTETGSWAGRNVTMETFLAAQQRYARQILTSWLEQIGLPLCKFHFGPDAFFSLELVPLNKSRMDQMGGQQQPGQPGQQRPIGNAPPPSTLTSMPPRQRLMSTEAFNRRIKTSPLATKAA